MRAESPEWLCRHSLVPIPPRAAASRTQGSCWWDLELNISFCGCKLIPAQDLSTSVFQLVASKVDGVQDRVGMAAERLGHPLHKVTVGRRVTHLSKVWAPPGNTATSPVALQTMPPGCLDPAHRCLATPSLTPSTHCSPAPAPPKSPIC